MIIQRRKNNEIPWGCVQETYIWLRQDTVTNLEVFANFISFPPLVPVLSHDNPVHIFIFYIHNCSMYSYTFTQILKKKIVIHTILAVYQVFEQDTYQY
jgi:hypothetical protein